MKPEASPSRRSFLRNGSLFLGGLIAASAGGYGYSRYLEPRLLQINTVELVLPRLPESFHGVRIVQFSDIHYDFHYSLDRLADLMDRIQALKPDLLVFTGDLYDSRSGTDGSECAGLLSRLTATLGKWAVLGNHDYIAGARGSSRVLEAGGFSVLTNSSVTVERGGETIRIAGVDDMSKGKPDLARALADSADNEFTLLLSHAPDFADISLKYPVDLQLSGHSHGGQVRLPFIGYLVLPQYADKYPEGLYVLGNGKLHAYTNRGIGVSTHPVRFLCRPELTVFILL